MTSLKRSSYPFTCTDINTTSLEVDNFLTAYGYPQLHEDAFLNLVDNPNALPLDKKHACHNYDPPKKEMPGTYIEEVREATMLLSRSLAIYIYVNDPSSCSNIAYDIAKIAGVVDNIHHANSTNKNLAAQAYYKKISRIEAEKHIWLLEFWSNLSPDLTLKLEHIKAKLGIRNQNISTLGESYKPPIAAVNTAKNVNSSLRKYDLALHTRGNMPSSTIPSELLTTSRLATWDYDENNLKPADLTYSSSTLDASGFSSLDSHGNYSIDHAPYHNHGSIQHNSRHNALLITSALYRTEPSGASTLWEKLGLNNNQLAAADEGLLKRSLRENEIIFRNHNGKLSRFTTADGSTVYHSVHLNDETPVARRAYQCRPEMKKIAQETLDELEQLGIIYKDTSSPWAAPTVFVRKAGTEKEWRMCIDYRTLNLRIKRCGMGMKTAEEIWDLCHGSEVYSTLDASKWFHQISLHPDVKKYFAFNSPCGTYQFNTLPQGYINAPFVAQALIESAFRIEIPKGLGLPHEGEIALDNIVTAYIDDILIYSDLKSHGKILAWVFSILKKHHVTLRPDKAHLFSKRIYFLGFYLEDSKLHVDPSKVDALKDMPKPTDVKSLMRFLGMVTYQRRFIPDMAKQTFHLTNLLKKENDWNWTDKCDVEHKYLIDTLSSPPALALPDYSREFFIRTDACDYGIGCVLGYYGEPIMGANGKPSNRKVRKIMAYQSRKLTPAEQRYDTRRKECLGIIWATEKNRKHLLGRRFVIESDHRNLTWLQKVKESTAQLYRWSVLLQQFDYEFRYVPGPQLQDADALSRAPASPNTRIADGPIYLQGPKPEQPIKVNNLPKPGPQSSGSLVPAEPCPKIEREEPTYNVAVLQHGLGTDHMALEGSSRYKTLSCYDSDSLAREMHQRITLGESVDNLETFVSDIKSTKARLHILRINSLPKRPRLDCERLIALCKSLEPQSVFLTDALGLVINSAHHREIEAAMVDLNYKVDAQIMNVAMYGDNTAKVVYVMIACKLEANFEWPEANTSFCSFEKLLQDPGTIRPSIRADHTHVPKVLHREDSAFQPMKCGTVCRGGERMDCYDPKYPLPAISTYYASFSTSNGAGWIIDEIGARKVQLHEQASLHAFSDKAKRMLANRSGRIQQRLIGESIPVNTIRKLYEKLLVVLDSSLPANMKLDASTSEQYVLGYIVANIMPTGTQISEEQKKDKDIAPIIKYLEQGKQEDHMPVNGPYARHLPYMRLQNGILFYREELGDELMTDAIVLPLSLKSQVLRALHDSEHCGHPGEKATKLAIRERVFWKKMGREITSYVKNCPICRRAKAHKRKNAGAMQSQLFYQPMERVGIDLCGPFIKSSSGNTFFFHMVDMYTAFNVVVPIPNKEASTVAKAFHQHVILKHGAPQQVLSDRGSEFLNKIFKSLSEQCGIHHLKTTPYRPTGNAATERGHKFFNGILKIARNSYGQDWDDAIQYACMVLNSKPISGTSVSPFELLFGFKPRTPADAMLQVGHPQDKSELSKDEYVKQLSVRWTNMEKVVTNARKQQMRRNHHQNAQLKYEYKYKEGDLVLVYRPNIKKGVTRKLLYQAAGPYEVMKEIHDNVYRLKRLGTDKLSIHNVSDICPFITKEHYQKRQDEATLAAGPSATEGPDELKPEPGDFLLFPGTASDNLGAGSDLDDHPERYPFYLCKVIDYNEPGSCVRIHYYNTYSKGKRPKLRGYFPAWKHVDTGVEQFAIKCPTKHEAVEDPDIPLDEFCPVKITPVKGSAKGAVDLKLKEIKRALGLRPRD